ncbi:unnamed protein product, partial [Ectocarpus sp. 4 AP-2014]
FVEVDLPQNQLTAEAVFEDGATVEAALADIYHQMREIGLTNGGLSGLGHQMGLYSDELDYYRLDGNNFYDHSLIASNFTASSWWDTSYNLIYAANAVVEGVENSASLSLEEQNKFIGEGLFIRSYLHVFLVELYGDIPYISTTDYIENTTVRRMPKAVVYERIVEDLILAANLLPAEDFTGERVRPYRAVANALLARAYLYSEQWEAAESAANTVINQFGGLESDLNKVFLK